MTMMEMLAKILDNACAMGETDGEGFREFYIETHCVAWTVRAKIVRRGRVNKWEIASAKPSAV